MPETKKTGEQSSEPRSSRASRDLAALVFIVAAVFAFSYFLNIFDFLTRFFQGHPGALTFVDEIISVLLALSVALSFFAWRRWQELKKETAARIKSQEELLRSAQTQAEVERIINKELHSDMDQIKDDVREVLCLLCNKRKGTAI
jgi:hypothetical protein